jgi:hypothetical protein
LQELEKRVKENEYINLKGAVDKKKEDQTVI